jgi:hypothetical protein
MLVNASIDISAIHLFVDEIMGLTPLLCLPALAFVAANYSPNI